MTTKSKKKKPAASPPAKPAPARGKGKLTARQQRFIDEYLIDLNATQAAIRAGYSKRTADKIGSQLLGKTGVRAAVEAATQARSARTEVTADAVVQELARLGFANMLDFIEVQPDGTALVDLKRLTREQAAAISEMTVDETSSPREDGKVKVSRRLRIKLADKRSSLELLGKHLGLFAERVEIKDTTETSTAELLAEGKRLIGLN